MKGTPYNFLKVKAAELAADAVNALLHAQGEPFRVMRGDIVITRRGGRVIIAMLEAPPAGATVPPPQVRM